MGLFKKKEDNSALFKALDEYLKKNYVPPVEAFGSAFAMPVGKTADLFSAKLEKRASKNAKVHFAKKSAETADFCADEIVPLMEEAEEAADSMNSGAVPAAMMDMVAEAKPARSIDEVISQVSESWQESLFRLIDEKGFSDTEVYKRADVDRKLFSKIRCSSDYRPKKNTAIAFALALRLNLDETKDFLMRAGYALSKSSRADLIVEFFIQNEVYDLITINTALYDHNEQALSS